MSEITVVGVSHRTAPVGVREKLSLCKSSAESPFDHFLQREEIAGLVLLSTCNRVEMYLSAGDTAGCQETAIDFLCRWGPLSRGDLSPWLYSFTGAQAAEHLFRVVSSLDSMVPGEPQIFGQVKQAYISSLFAGAVDPRMNHLFQRAFAVAKRIRRETGIGRLGVSVSSVAIQFVMRQQHTPVRDQMVILIGAGEMAEQAAQALFKSGVGEVLVTNRTYQRSVEVARQIGGKAFRFEDLPRLLPEVDIIIASTSAPHYLLTRQSLAAILPERSKPLFIIDISVPRCIDPEIEGLDSVFFADIDRLQELGAQNLKTRMEEAKKAEEIIQKETRKFSNWLKERKVAPLISALHGQAEQIRKQELARTLGRAGNGNGVDPEVLDRVTRAVVKRILVTPTRRLRQEAVDNAHSHHIQSLFQILFEIDPTPGKKQE